LDPLHQDEDEGEGGGRESRFYTGIEGSERNSSNSSMGQRRRGRDSLRDPLDALRMSMPTDEEGTSAAFLDPVSGLQV
jgi:hypothetical protein